MSLGPQEEVGEEGVTDTMAPPRCPRSPPTSTSLEVNELRLRPGTQRARRRHLLPSTRATNLGVGILAACSVAAHWRALFQLGQRFILQK